MLLELIFTVILQNITDGRTHKIPSSWAPVGAKNTRCPRKNFSLDAAGQAGTVLKCSGYQFSREHNTSPGLYKRENCETCFKITFIFRNVFCIQKQMHRQPSKHWKNQCAWESQFYFLWKYIHASMKDLIVWIPNSSSRSYLFDTNKNVMILKISVEWWCWGVFLCQTSIVMGLGQQKLLSFKVSVPCFGRGPI